MLWYIQYEKSLFGNTQNIWKLCHNRYWHRQDPRRRTWWHCKLFLSLRFLSLTCGGCWSREKRWGTSIEEIGKTWRKGRSISCSWCLCLYHETELDLATVTIAESIALTGQQWWMTTATTLSKRRGKRRKGEGERRKILCKEFTKLMCRLDESNGIQKMVHHRSHYPLNHPRLCLLYVSNDYYKIKFVLVEKYW